ncbi:MAG: Rid family detoxifying hydrolase [Treponemataceae bacterium]|nr:Rid family detoxifying hydrolase [Treponemataceae bacterium]
MARGEKEVISPKKGGAPLGPYSPGVRIPGGLVFFSGQIPIDPVTGNLVGPDIHSQTQRCLENLQMLLEAAGLNLTHVVKTTVYLVDMADFSALNEIYATFFPQNPPARTTVAVAALPRGARIEVEAIALAPGE